ncbi:MAG: response regulator [Bacteroidota bacterium]|jgi:DNA-binding NarL/FixJ family response regulator
MIRVAIFDDNADRRDSLGLLISSSEGLELVGSYDDANNALRDIRNSRPHVVLMDIGMPGVSGIEATTLIKGSYPEIQIVIQTVFDDQAKIFDAIKAGASGYILKSAPISKIIDAIKDANEGGASLTPQIAALVIQYFREQETAAKTPDYGLSEREKEVLGHLISGLSYKQIADKMNLSYNTINSHIKRIYEKLHVHSVAEAVAKTINQRLLDNK